MDYPRIGCAVKVRRAHNSTAAVSVPRHLTPAPDRACILPLSLRRQRHGSSASSRPDDLGKPAGHDVQTAGTRVRCPLQHACCKTHDRPHPRPHTHSCPQIKIPAHVLRPRSLFSFDGSAGKEADSAVSRPRYIPTISCPGELPIPFRVCIPRSSPINLISPSAHFPPRASATNFTPQLCCVIADSQLLARLLLPRACVPSSVKAQHKPTARRAGRIRASPPWSTAKHRAGGRAMIVHLLPHPRCPSWRARCERQ